MLSALVISSNLKAGHLSAPPFPQRRTCHFFGGWGERGQRCPLAGAHLIVAVPDYESVGQGQLPHNHPLLQQRGSRLREAVGEDHEGVVVIQHHHRICLEKRERPDDEAAFKEFTGDRALARLETQAPLSLQPRPFLACCI